MGKLTFVPVEVRLQIGLQGLLHIGTGLGRGSLLDDTVICGPHPTAANRPILPYIPGSSLKGRVRFHARRLAEVLVPLERWRPAEAHLFGSDDQPGGLVFADAHVADLTLAETLGGDPSLAAAVRGQRSFVALSRLRRVALEQRLFRIEVAARDLEFAATISGVLPNDQAVADVGLLLAAISDLSHLGGHKGRGLGRCRASIQAVAIDGQQADWQAVMRQL